MEAVIAEAGQRVRVIAAWPMSSQSGSKEAKCILQRFGGVIHLNRHFHVSVLEGVYLDRTDQDRKPHFGRGEPPSDADVAEFLQKSSRWLIRTLRYRRYLGAGLNAAVASGSAPLLDNEPELSHYDRRCQAGACLTWGWTHCIIAAITQEVVIRWILRHLEPGSYCITPRVGIGDWPTPDATGIKCSMHRRMWLRWRVSFTPEHTLEQTFKCVQKTQAELLQRLRVQRSIWVFRSRWVTVF